MLSWHAASRAEGGVVLEDAAHRAVALFESCGDLADGPALFVQARGVAGHHRVRVGFGGGDQGADVGEAVAAVAAGGEQGGESSFPRPAGDRGGAYAEHL